MSQAGCCRATASRYLTKSGDRTEAPGRPSARRPSRGSSTVPIFKGVGCGGGGGGCCGEEEAEEEEEVEVEVEVE